MAESVSIQIYRFSKPLFQLDCIAGEASSGAHSQSVITLQNYGNAIVKKDVRLDSRYTTVIAVAKMFDLWQEAAA